MNNGTKVHHHLSPQGKRILEKQKLSLELLAKAIAEYQKAERLHVGTAIGMHKRLGFFFSDRDDWHPDQSNAFSDPLGVIPWEQVHELLANAPPSAEIIDFKPFNR